MVDKPKLLKITMEFEDKIQTLEGEEAENWLKACNSSIMLDTLHGNPFPEFKWKIEKR